MTPSSRFVTAPLLVAVTAMFLAIRPVSIHPYHDNSFTMPRPPKGTRGTVLVGIGNSIRGTRDLELHSRLAGARRFLDVGEDMTGEWYPRQNQKRAGKRRIESSCDACGVDSVQRGLKSHPGELWTNDQRSRRGVRAERNKKVLCPRARTYTAASVRCGPSPGRAQTSLRGFSGAWR